MIEGLTCRFGDPRKENCDMMCRPLRAVIVERRYAFILSYRDICVVFRFHQVTRWNKYVRKEHYLSSFLGIVSLAINRVWPMIDRVTNDGRKKTDKKKKKKKNRRDIFHCRARFIAPSSTRSYSTLKKVFSSWYTLVALSQTRRHKSERERESSLPISDHKATRRSHPVRTTLSVFEEDSSFTSGTPR